MDHSSKKIKRGREFLLDYKEKSIELKLFFKKFQSNRLSKESIVYKILFQKKKYVTEKNVAL